MSNTIHVADDGDTSSKLREWSSLIGIVTAIVGNIFISFALNIQRYAHIRLDREQDKKNEQWSDGRVKIKSRNYGTQQSEIAEERTQLNLHALPEDERNSKSQYGSGNGNNGITAERESLHSRSSSDSTIRQSEKLKPQADRKIYLKSPYWWAGLILMIVGEGGNFIAYGFAPASIVSPLGVVALISNCIIAPVLLKERFRQRDFWGVAIAIAGAVTIVLSAKNSETKMGPHDVWAAITRWEFETYLGITAALIIILMWASGKYGERTILIDLGLVALFGNLIPGLLVSKLTNMYRRLHCPIHQRCRIIALRHSLARSYVPHHIPSCLHPCRYGSPPDTLRQLRPTTLRLDPSHPCTICPLHYICHHRKRCALPGLSIGQRRPLRKVLRGLCVDISGRLSDHEWKGTGM